MEYKHTFAGVSSNGNTDWEKEFDIVYDCGTEMIAVSKDEYKCYLGEKTINYRIGVQLDDSEEFNNDDPTYIVASMYLIPAYRNLSRDNREDIIKFAGDSMIDLKKYGKKDDLTYYQDVISYGTTVFLASDSCNYTDRDDYEEKTNQIMNDIANTYNGVTGLIGFYLDRPTNMIGMTGWDWLRMHCNGVKMKTIMKDLKKRYEA